ncbi:MAG TPA: hypothetical protein VLT45_24745 [Kofleriaceae bacterium]|nr:hypothetical protein [Kofleriaceae bacterium]
MKSLLLAALALTACAKQGPAMHTERPAPERPAPALRDICTDARFQSLCTPVQMPGPTQIDINTAGRHPANPPAFG